MIKKTVDQLNNLSKIINQNKTALCIGTFDGVHKGHKLLLEKTNFIANKNNLKSLTIVFKKRPREFINKNEKQSYLSDLHFRINKISQQGIDYIYPLDFNNEIKNLSAKEFLYFLKKLANMTHLIVSEKTNLGYDQLSGDDLFKLCENLKLGLTFVKMNKLNEQIISTSSINSLIKSGKIEKANTYLGDFYKVKGKVIKGDRIGSELGFPTANLEISSEILAPGDGVYACYVNIENKSFFGALSIGDRPTLKNNYEHKIEVHIIDFNENIYDKSIEISIVKKIRDQVRYESLDKLKKQIKIDINNIFQILKSKKYE
jgi:riboflavin kinase/FMN adenylyltransferase